MTATAPILSEEDARAITCFDALMWALSRPGLTRDLPEPGMVCVVEALLDRECAAYADDPELARAIARSGAVRATPDQADHVFAKGVTPDMLRQLRQGSDLHPEEGATLITQARIGQGTRLRLTGPGIDGAVEIALDLPPETWPLRADLMRYPTGFEIFVIDGARVVGLPRSTAVEVL